MNYLFSEFHCLTSQIADHPRIVLNRNAKSETLTCRSTISNKETSNNQTKPSCDRALQSQRIVITHKNNKIAPRRKWQTSRSLSNKTFIVANLNALTKCNANTIRIYVFQMYSFQTLSNIDMSRDNCQTFTKSNYATGCDIFKSVTSCGDKEFCECALMRAAIHKSKIEYRVTCRVTCVSHMFLQQKPTEWQLLRCVSNETVKIDQTAPNRTIIN